MIVSCPTCTEAVSLDGIAIADIISSKLTCPICGEGFKPGENSKAADDMLEELKDELTILRSLELKSRLFDDCWKFLFIANHNFVIWAKKLLLQRMKNQTRSDANRAEHHGGKTMRAFLSILFSTDIDQIPARKKKKKNNN